MAADTRHVALLGHPVAHSLSPVMQNAAFAEAGLDWDYAAFDVEDPVAAVGALVTLGFAGANVTIPHKQSVVAACDEAEGEAVNTLVFRDGRVLGFNTDKEILAGIARDPGLRDRRRAARRARSSRRSPQTRGSTRAARDWPPDAAGCDLVVNATPVRDGCWSRLSPEQTVVDLAYGAEGRQRSSRRRARSGARSSTASRRSSGRERRAFACGPVSSLPST